MFEMPELGDAFAKVSVRSARAGSQAICSAPANLARFNPRTLKREVKIIRSLTGGVLST